MSCVAESTHTVSTDQGDGVKTYEWTVSSNVYIKSGQGTATVVVGSDSEVFESFDLTCLITDDTGNSILTANFIHERADLPGIPNEDTFYIMNEPLVNTNQTLDFIIADPADNGTFRGDDGVAYTPNATEYPGDGTTILVNGDYIEIPHAFPANEKWQFVRCYNIDGRNFEIMVIVYHGNNKATFLFGNQDISPMATQGNTNLAYTPMVGNYRIGDTLDYITRKVVYDMSSSFEYKVIYDMTTEVA